MWRNRLCSRLNGYAADNCCGWRPAGPASRRRAAGRPGSGLSSGAGVPPSCAGNRRLLRCCDRSAVRAKLAGLADGALADVGHRRAPRIDGSPLVGRTQIPRAFAMKLLRTRPPLPSFIGVRSAQFSDRHQRAQPEPPSAGSHLPCERRSGATSTGYSLSTEYS